MKVHVETKRVFAERVRKRFRFRLDTAVDGGRLDLFGRYDDNSVGLEFVRNRESRSELFVVLLATAQRWIRMEALSSSRR